MGMTRTDRLKAIITLLQSLPLIRFALMLGGGVVATAGAAWVMWVLSHGKWPAGADVAIARINALSLMGGGCLLIIGIVMIALAWGKVQHISVKTAAGELSVDVDDDDDPPPTAPAAAVVTTTTTTTPAAPLASDA